VATLRHPNLRSFAPRLVASKFPCYTPARLVGFLVYLFFCLNAPRFHHIASPPRPVFGTANRVPEPLVWHVSLNAHSPNCCSLRVLSTAPLPDGLFDDDSSGFLFPPPLAAFCATHFPNRLPLDRSLCFPSCARLVITPVLRSLFSCLWFSSRACSFLTVSRNVTFATRFTGLPSVSPLRSCLLGPFRATSSWSFPPACSH